MRIEIIASHPRLIKFLKNLRIINLFRKKILPEYDYIETIESENKIICKFHNLYTKNFKLLPFSFNASVGTDEEEDWKNFVLPITKYEDLPDELKEIVKEILSLR